MSCYFLKIIYVLLLLLLHISGSIFGFNSATKSGEVKCIEKERRVLIKFKQGIQDGSGMLSTWMDDESDGDCCKWEGIQCHNQTGYIQGLHLRGSDTQRLIGVVNFSLLIELQNMEYLDFSGNFFLGSRISKLIGSFSNLRHLDLSSCSFGGKIPSQIKNLFLLQHLDLSGNMLNEAIPYQLGELAHLRYLDLSHNYLSEAIPHQLGELSHLRYLDLSYNYLEGPIPYQLGNLAQLHYLGLGGNSLLGTIPFQLGNLPELQFLKLGGNSDLKINKQNHADAKWLSNLSLTNLELTLHDLGSSHHWLHGIGKLLPNLQELRLSGCNLSDSNIVFLFGSHSNVSTSLTTLDLSDNILTSSTFQWLLNSTFPSLVNLNLSHNNLTSSISNLNFGSKLQQLYLRNCSLLDTNFLVPSVSNMNFSSSLVNLDLSSNHLRSSNIFYWLFNFTTSLTYLCLNNNILEGHIPNCFGNMLNSLEYLDLSSNKLQGEIPTSFGNMRTLHILYLADNQFIGEITKSIGLLSELNYLDLRRNSLEGDITESDLANLSKLSYLSFSGNSLSLKFGTGWVPPSQLTYLLLASCNLGPSFPSWLRTLSYLRRLDISNNGIIDFVPEWFWNKLEHIQELNMSHNSLIGTIPNLPLMLSFKPSIVLHSNQFEGGVPSSLVQASMLTLSQNKISNLDSFLCGTGATANLVTLDLSNNRIKGQLLDCWEPLHSLLFLDLSNNELSGKIPLSMGHLVKVEALVLRNNRLIGDLPSTLKNCTNLIMLDVGENLLSGPIPSWIGENLQQLIILILRGNQFSGNLPLHLCYLTQIQVLDLSQNNLSKGIPTCVKNFAAMARKSINSSETLSHIYWLNDAFYDLYGSVALLVSSYNFNISLMWKGTEYPFKDPELRLKSIDLSSNHFTGDIPTEFGQLLGLVSLNLSRNNLSGEITSGIGNLSSLEFLDLSRNHLSGRIPSTLSEIDGLGVLDLSHNSLSGKIPMGRHLQTFGASSFEGNPDLCGPQLNKSCPEDGTPVQPQEPAVLETDDNSLFSEALYMGLGLGFFTGFWGFLGPILLRRAWRNAYIMFLNKLIDHIYVMVAVNVAKFNRWLRG